jgi:hypothetical protein
MHWLHVHRDRFWMMPVDRVGATLADPRPSSSACSPAPLDLARESSLQVRLIDRPYAQS